MTLICVSDELVMMGFERERESILMKRGKECGIGENGVFMVEGDQE